MKVLRAPVGLGGFNYQEAMLLLQADDPNDTGNIIKAVKDGSTVFLMEDDGEITVIGDITASDLDIDAGTGDYTSTGIITLADTTTSTTGVIYKGAFPFLHNFHHPTGGGAIPDGENTFVGLFAGNFTTGSTATLAAESSRNTGTGFFSLPVLTKGFNNTAYGHESFLSLTEGSKNTGMGRSVGANITLGSENTLIGNKSGLSLTTGDNCIFVGNESGMFQTTADGILIIDGFARSSIGDETVSVIIRGVMDLTAANQTLTFNAATTITNTLAATGLTIGNMVLGDGTIVDAGGIAFSSTDLSGIGTIDSGSITSTGTVQAEQLTSTDDITMQGHTLTLGDGSATNIVTSYSADVPATMTYNRGNESFDFDKRITATTVAGRGGQFVATSGTGSYSQSQDGSAAIAEQNGTLTGNNGNPTFQAFRNGILNGFQYTGPVLAVDDNIAGSTGDLIRVTKSGLGTVFLMDSTGSITSKDITTTELITAGKFRTGDSVITNGLISFGDSTTSATGVNGIAMAINADAVGDNSISVGADSSALNANALSVGVQTISVLNATAVGFRAEALSSGSTSVGFDAVVGAGVTGGSVQVGDGTNTINARIGFGISSINYMSLTSSLLSVVPDIKITSGVLFLNETTTPTRIDDHGAIYTKNTNQT